MLYIIYHAEYYDNDNIEVVYKFESDQEGQDFMFDKYERFLSYGGVFGISVDSRIDGLKPINDNTDMTNLQVIRTSLFEDNEEKEFDSYPSIVKQLIREERINNLL